MTFEKADAEKQLKRWMVQSWVEELQVALAKDRSKEPPNLTDDRVHVGNLPSDYSKEEFVKLLSSFGECILMYLMVMVKIRICHILFTGRCEKAVESLSPQRGNVLEVMFARKENREDRENE